MTTTIKQMIDCGASEAEAKQALELFEMLRPGLKVKSNGTVSTSMGNKTFLGLYRSIVCQLFNQGKGDL